MHELAIASSVVEIACRHAGDRRVARVELRVGHLRQVVPDALTFSFELVAQGTVVEGADLVIQSVPAVGACRGCGTYTELRAFPLQCAACGGFELDIVAGEELDVESLEVEEDQVGAITHEDHRR
jgi:hydrogenase nickel incorporation protein HypA/HybF